MIDPAHTQLLLARNSHEQSLMTLEVYTKYDIQTDRKENFQVFPCDPGKLFKEVDPS